MKITMADVAQRAGVSMMTVSRVINNKNDVSEKTRRKVRHAIEQLNYQPNAVARSLTTRRTQTLGVMVPDITNPFFSGIVRGAEDAAAEQGYSLILCNTVEDQERERTVLALFEQKRVDGVIACSSRLPDDALLDLVGLHPAAVLINREQKGDIAGTVRVDDAYGALRVVRHLLARGRKTIGFLAGLPDSYSGKQRTRGWSAALESSGRTLDPSLVKSCRPYEEDGYEAARELLTAHPEMDALACFNDLVAIGALRACRDLGIRVPEQLAVVGCDDIRAASLVTPSVTTLRVSQYDIGVKAARMLLNRIEGKEDNEDALIRPELVVRESAP